jgi:hypothetical protein
VRLKASTVSPTVITSAADDVLKTLDHSIMAECAGSVIAVTKIYAVSL